MASLLTRTVDHILGSPFRLRGRGPIYFDCLGLVIYLYREVYGVVLTDPFSDDGIAEGIRLFKESFVRVEDVTLTKPGDILHLYSEGKLSDQHLAFVESRKWNVVAMPDTGVCRVKLKDLSWYDTIKAYRYDFDHTDK